MRGTTVGETERRETLMTRIAEIGSLLDAEATG